MPMSLVKLVPRVYLDYAFMSSDGPQGAAGSSSTSKAPLAASSFPPGLVQATLLPYVPAITHSSTVITSPANATSAAAPAVTVTAVPVVALASAPATAPSTTALVKSAVAAVSNTATPADAAIAAAATAATKGNNSTSAPAGSSGSAAPAKPKKRNTRGKEDFIAGSFAGAVARFIVSPLDMLKIRFQLQTTTGDTRKYRSLRSAAATVLREEGLRAFWKGNLLATCMIAPYSATTFMVNQQIKAMFLESNRTPHPVFSLFSGGAAGAAGVAVTYPLDLLRTRFAAQHGSKGYESIFAAVRSILRQSGVKGFYDGLRPALVGIVPYMGVQFALFDATKKFLQANHDTLVDALARTRLRGDSARVLAFVSEQTKELTVAARARIEAEGRKIREAEVLHDAEKHNAAAAARAKQDDEAAEREAAAERARSKKAEIIAFGRNTKSGAAETDDPADVFGTFNDTAADSATATASGSVSEDGKKRKKTRKWLRLSAEEDADASKTASGSSSSFEDKPPLSRLDRVLAEARDAAALAAMQEREGEGEFSTSLISSSPTGTSSNSSASSGTHIADFTLSPFDGNRDNTSASTASSTRIVTDFNNNNPDADVALDGSTGDEEAALLQQLTDADAALRARGIQTGETPRSLRRRAREVIAGTRIQVRRALAGDVGRAGEGEDVELANVDRSEAGNVVPNAAGLALEGKGAAVEKFTRVFRDGYGRDDTSGSATTAENNNNNKNNNSSGSIDSGKNNSADNSTDILSDRGSAVTEALTSVDAGLAKATSKAKLLASEAAAKAGDKVSDKVAQLQSKKEQLDAAAKEQKERQVKPPGFLARRYDAFIEGLRGSTGYMTAVAGLVAGAGGKFVTFPFDVIKKRFQVATFEHANAHFVAGNSGANATNATASAGAGAGAAAAAAASEKMTIASCARRIVRAEGIRGLFKGIVPAVLKSGPSAAITFSIYEISIHFLTKDTIGGKGKGVADSKLH